MKKVALKSGDVMVIEQASPDDAAEILQFLQMAAGEGDTLVSTPEDFDFPVESERGYLEEQARQPASTTLCGKVDGRVMAIASLATSRRERLAHTSELSVMVGRAYWNQGAGAALIDALMEFAQETGRIRLVHLGVRADNAAAIALYRKKGFEDAGCFKNFMCVNGQYHDQILMAREVRL